MKQFAGCTVLVVGDTRMNFDILDDASMDIHQIALDFLDFEEQRQALAEPFKAS